MSVIVCTICSREKDKSTQSMPAHERYKSDRIKHVRMIARAAHKSYYILSGKFGLLKAYETVPSYDYVLGDEDVSRLSYLIGSRLSQEGVTEVLFYTKSLREWAPYLRAMELACTRGGVKLRVVSLDKG